MASLDDLLQRVEHLLVRHEELQRTQALLQRQVRDLSAERDDLRRRLQTARTRVDALLERLPTGTAAPGALDTREADAAPDAAGAATGVNR